MLEGGRRESRRESERVRDSERALKRVDSERALKRVDYL